MNNIVIETTSTEEVVPVTKADAATVAPSIDGVAPRHEDSQPPSGLRADLTDLYNEGNAHLENKEHEAGYQCFHTITQAEPGCFAAWNQKGLCLAGQRRYEDTLRCFDQGLERSPNCVGLLLNRGQVLQVLGRTEESIQSLNRAIELDPEDPETWLMKGYILQGMKKPDDALKCFETAWKLIPTTVEVSKVRTKGKKTVRASKKGKKARNTSKTKKNKR